MPKGGGATASGDASHAEGNYTVASGVCSHAEGLYTSTNSLASAHIMGQNGSAIHPWSWHLANGQPIGPTLLAAYISGVTGNGVCDGAWIGGGADYAEMFETVDGNPIECGYFVTLESDWIRKATPDDTYILGVTSANPSFLADGGELRWHGTYLTDDWGRKIYQETLVPAIIDQEGSVIYPEHVENRPVINPEFDNSKTYIPRLQRPEWAPVALMGKLRVREDGTCEVNGFCYPNAHGIATKADQGYRVMKRTGPNQVLILFR